MAFDDMTAFGAIRTLTNCGIRVPEQVSVIGFDDIAHPSLLTPALTTVRQPMPEMGEMAVSIVAESISALREKRRLAAMHRKLLPQLVVRDSTCSPL
jgi:LacI family transcriptional regulator